MVQTRRGQKRNNPESPKKPANDDVKSTPTPPTTPGKSTPSKATTPVQSSQKKRKETPSIEMPTSDNSSGLSTVGSPPKSPPKSSKPGLQGGAEHKIHFEFGGPIGAIGVIFGLPLVIFALHFLCNKDYCVGHHQFSIDAILKNLPSLQSLYSRESLVMYSGWMAFHVILERLLPGKQNTVLSLRFACCVVYLLNLPCPVTRNIVIRFRFQNVPAQGKRLRAYSWRTARS